MLGEFAGLAGQGDAAAFQHIGAVRDRERLHDVLLDQQDRQPFGIQPADQREHLLDQQGGEAERRLVEDQELGLAHQAAADRQHLLLAAGQGSCRLRPALLEAREDRDDMVEVLLPRGAAAAIAAELEIVAHREIGEDAAAFRHLDQAGFDDPLGRFASDVAALETDRAAERPVDAADIVVERRLAGAVAAQQRHDLARTDREVDAAQDLDRAVTSAQTADLKHASPWRRRGRDRLR